VNVNCDGFRNIGVEQPADATLQVFALGDSLTFGMGVADDETWPARLNNLLNVYFSGGVRVVNGGTVSYGVFQELDLLRDWLPHIRPQIVVHSLYWNDYQSAHPPRPDAPSVLTADGHFVWDPNSRENTPLSSARRWLRGHSSLMTVLRGVLPHVRKREESPLQDYEVERARLLAGKITLVNWEPVEEFYKALLALGEKYRFKSYVVIFPLVEIINDPDVLEHPYHRYVVDLLDSLGIPYLDGIALWKDKGYGLEMFLHPPADPHLNARGYEAIASALATRLMKSNHYVLPAGK